MDRSAQNIDRSSESEIMNLRRLKYAFDVSPLEIIHDEEDLIHGGGGGGGGVLNINQISLVIHAIDYDTIFQYWSLKSDQQQLNSSSSSCHDQYHRDHHHHHLRDDDDDEEMIMVVCQPLCPPTTRDQIILLNRGIFESNYAAEDDDDHHIMSQLNDVDALYELEWIGTYKQLEEVKRSIIQRISESKLDVQLAKPPPKTVRIRLDLSVIHKKYYANPAAAASAHAEYQLGQLAADEAFAIHYPAVPACKIKYVPPYKIKYGNVSTPALRSSQEALETKIFNEQDLISSSSCSLCSKEFLVGVDVTKKMPCSHLFHSFCLAKRLSTTNTCPLCYYKLPTFRSRFLKDQLRS